MQYDCSGFVKIADVNQIDHLYGFQRTWWPSYGDQSEITAIAAAHIACDMLCLMRNKKVAGTL
ncbi:hypothetical protein GCM10011290_29100 [Vogesella alkaliphila]|uniref:Uncharacterized protein n=1 Tax=Vogesella alkaliphila TaxID=1193621 RepID=A0ABQ2Z1C6_9NEIS|nr:hypothetical protein GCM10011290_29100 [Vogesella alkaliphila]